MNCVEKWNSHCVLVCQLYHSRKKSLVFIPATAITFFHCSFLQAHTFLYWVKSKHRQITQDTDSHYTATSLPAPLSPPWLNTPILRFTTANYMGKGKRKYLCSITSRSVRCEWGGYTPSLEPKMKSWRPVHRKLIPSCVMPKNNQFQSCQ